ncbi:APC family permease [Actinokineospora iranica]|uniref:Amino acid/polyamine/organocation transporter, APC superfamily n=1 Tax=Actinokineospora iranica TaxID=1271860 RepID=A0A1G6PG33_9PSEU|nr:APC family permease [Actinokineospora iranica]SDC78961.1 amino acid/polyamine/organocation transporter, APC superfamily [Actinokineospora iranica]
MTPPVPPAAPHGLARRLGPLDATAIGLGSILGAGVFAVFAPAAATAGAGLLVALVLAGFVAYCNATASAQLAAVYPASGGTYVFGREVLGPWWGFAAGWGFVVGKTASCAAMALTFAAYVAPGWERPVALAAVAVLTVVNCFGITRTAALTKVLLVVVLVVLLTAAAVSLPAAAPINWSNWAITGPLGVLQAAGLLFFAFAGYARIATLGEEVRDPAKTIPRAIMAALAGAILVYLLLGVTLLLVLGPDRLAASTTPLADLVTAAGHPGVAPVVRVGAAAASLGALLALITGIGRTTMAMARNRDLPPFLAAVAARHGVPLRAEIAVGVLVCGLVLVGDLREVIGFSSFGVLVYYAVANASAFRQPAAQRRWPRPLNLVGLTACLVLVATLPTVSQLVGLAVFAVGLLGRLALTARATGS